MGAMGDNNLSEKIVQAKKLATNLQSDDNFQKRQALKQLETYLSNKEEFAIGDYHHIFNEIQLYTLNLLRDKSEPVREQSVNFARFLILECLPINDYYLSYLFPILVERLGSVEIIEESEEMRLKLVEFIAGIIEKYSERDQLKPFLNDIIKIFCETVKDKYPAIKELTCKSIVALAKALPRDFHSQCEVLIKPVLTCFGHQRYKIRVEAVKCIGELVMHSTYKGLEDSVVPMAERLFDQIPIVRRTVAQVTARWLLEYRDRYSFFQKLLPLILTGLIDEVPDTRNEAAALWNKVGKQYEQENEEDLKDQINFLNDPPKYYAEGLQRPNLGCRVLVQKNVGRMVSALSNELTSWQGDIRVRCSQLLCAVALHAESGFTHHLQGILPAMYSAARDEDKRVVDNIIKASELLGLFVPYESWSKIILPTIEDGPHYGHLLVLAGLIRGSPKEYIEAHLEEPSKILADPFILFSRKAPYQKELYNCVDALISKLPSSKNNREVERHLFIIIVCLVALKSKESENEKIQISLLDNLSSSLSLTTSEIWSRNLNELLTIINKDPKSWTIVTPERSIIETILLESNTAFVENLEAIGDCLVKTLNVEADPEARLTTFIALSKSFEDKEKFVSGDLSKFMELLIEEVFIPSLVWRAGATAEAMRTMSASCLLSALSPNEKFDIFSNPESLKSVWENMLPLLISLSEDASSRSRALALENIVAIKELLVPKSLWDVEYLVKIYPEILKRLDDPTNFVRTCAIKALSYIFTNCPDDFKKQTYKAHHEMVLDTLLVHFDDEDKDFQDNVMDVFKVLGEICKETICERVKKQQNNLRNKEGCNQILAIIS